MNRFPFRTTLVALAGIVLGVLSDSGILTSAALILLVVVVGGWAFWGEMVSRARIVTLLDDLIHRRTGKSGTRPPN